MTVEGNIIKPVVGVYTQRYLNPSMTFVYRQISSVTAEFSPVVLTSNPVNNLDIYPVDKIFSKEKSPLGRLYRFYKKKTGHFAVLSRAQINYYKKILKENNAALIHAHFGPSAIEILPVAKELDLPLLVTFHGYDASSLLNNSNYVNDLKPVFEYADVIAVSNYMAQRLIEKGALSEKIRVIYYGISAEKFPFIDRTPVAEKHKRGEKVTFLQVSNFNRKKGHKYTVEAFKRALEKYSNLRLILAGDGELKTEIEQLCQSYKINSCVEFPGNVNPYQVYDYMKQADVFVHHSVTAPSGDQEGIPNVIIEAMATGLPVISTFHAGIPELITDGKNGFLVKEKDVDGYVNAIDCALHSESSVNRNASEKVMNDFNLEHQGRKLIEAYKEIITTKK